MKNRESYMRMFLICTTFILSSLMNRTLKCVNGFQFVHRRRGAAHTYSPSSTLSQIKTSCTAIRAKKGVGRKDYIDNDINRGDSIDESQYLEWVEEEKQVHYGYCHHH